jgi:hypothetical protein
MASVGNGGPVWWLEEGLQAGLGRAQGQGHVILPPKDMSMHRRMNCELNWDIGSCRLLLSILLSRSFCIAL